MTIIEKLLDESNEDNITLYDNEDRAIEFEQLAVIEDGDKSYAVLHPVNVPGVDDDEAVVFYIDEEKDVLTVEENHEIAERVFNEFLALLEDEE